MITKADEIKHRLRERHDMTLKGFAEKYNFRYATVSHVVRGINKATGRKPRVRSQYCSLSKI